MAIPTLEILNISGSNILADKAYGTNDIRTYIKENNAEYTIPPKENTINPWFCDYHIYKERHLVECFFNKIKAFRRVATRYDKLATSFLAFVYIASIWILSKQHVNLSFQIGSNPITHAPIAENVRAHLDSDILYIAMSENKIRLKE